ncbi:CDP-glucose 4,6-dehydratase [Cohnella rhizosphaerae]|uniref:CDP-glucose 4,6-dehydratase n=1 Tax=Cohnella rhizosphaerae TaxID=1457232 RepID=UPI0030B8D2BC
MEALGMIDIDAAFWSGRKVFVTGHTGFKGSWLCLWLRALGAEVTGYGRMPPAGPSLFELARIGRTMTSVIGDVRDPEGLAGAMRRAAPEVVLHLAAQPLVRTSYRQPVETYATNVMGTVHLLEAVRACGSVRAVVIVTTDKCYENDERDTGYAEHDRLGGRDPYSSSKACAELVAAAYRSSYFHPAHDTSHGAAVATARSGNVIGGGDWAQDRLVPDCLDALLNGERIRLRSPGAIRPWQHVLEPLGGYLLLAQRLFRGGIRICGSLELRSGGAGYEAGIRAGRDTVRDVGRRGRLCAGRRRREPSARSACAEAHLHESDGKAGLAAEVGPRYGPRQSRGVGARVQGRRGRGEAMPGAD